MDGRPVGVFDSGMGGLTVLHECLVTMPHEDFVYLGDAARLPYGPRPLPEIRRFAREIAGFLAARDVKLILVACNAATSAALPELQAELDAIDAKVAAEIEFEFGGSDAAAGDGETKVEFAILDYVFHEAFAFRAGAILVPLGGAGGNPHVFVQFLNAAGTELSDPIYVGRCNQL